MSILLFIHCWKVNNGIHTFPKSIWAMWNANSLIQDLNSCSFPNDDDYCTTCTSFIKKFTRWFLFLTRTESFRRSYVFECWFYDSWFLGNVSRINLLERYPSWMSEVSNLIPKAYVLNVIRAWPLRRRRL